MENCRGSSSSAQQRTEEQLHVKVLPEAQGQAPRWWAGTAPGAHTGPGLMPVSTARLKRLTAYTARVLRRVPPQEWGKNCPRSNTVLGSAWWILQPKSICFHYHRTKLNEICRNIKIKSTQNAKVTISGIQSKISRHAKKKEKNNCKEERNWLVETNPDLRYHLELADTDFKTVITIFNMFKNLYRHRN